jgi:hypothetical protein
MLRAANAGSSPNDIVFRMGIEAMPGYKANLDKMKKDAVGTQNDILKATTDTAKQGTSVVVAEAKKRDEQYKRTANYIQQLNAESRNAAASIGSHNAKIFESTRMMAAGFSSVARSIALVGVASGSDLEKAVRVLAKVEVGIHAISGGMSLIEGGVRTWRAYAAAVSAAAAAQGAVTLGSQIRAVGAGTTVAAGIGVGTAGFAAGAYAGSRLLSDTNQRQFARDVTDPLGITDQAGADRAASDQAQSQFQRQLNSRNRGLDDRFSAIRSRNAAEIQLGELNDPGGGGRNLAFSQYRDAKAEMAAVDVRRNRSQIFDASTSDREKAEYGRVAIDALQNIIRFEQEREQVTIRRAQSAIQLAREETNIVRGQVELEKEKLAAIQQGNRGIAISFGQMSRGEQRRVEQAAGAARSGAKLNRTDANLLRSVGLRGIADNADMDRGIEAMGANSNVRALMQAEFDKQSAIVRDVNVKLESKISGELKITANEEEMVKRIQDVIRNFEKQLVGDFQKQNLLERAAKSSANAAGG